MPEEMTPTPLDARLEALAAARFESVLRRNPVLATFMGRHAADDRLGDLSPEGVERDLAEVRAYIADLEALDPAGLSASARFERELALWAARKERFTSEEIRHWERRATAVDEVGDGLFGLFARDFAPLTARLESISGRLEDAPRVMAEQQRRLTRRPVALWHAGRAAPGRGAADLLRRDRGRRPRRVGRRRPGPRPAAERPSAVRTRRSRTTAAGCGSSWARPTTTSPSAASATTSWSRLRAFDGLTTREILEIGEQQLAEQKAARVAVAREIDPDAGEAEVLDRVKNDHPATFEQALEEYRDGDAPGSRAPRRAGPGDDPRGRASAGRRRPPSTCAT